MLRFAPPPPDLRDWLLGTVCVETPAGLARTCFPALPHAMLVWRSAGQAFDARAPQRPVPPLAFHTLSSRPGCFLHAGAVSAVGLLVRPAAAACLLGASAGAQADAVLPWDAVAGRAEAGRLLQAATRAGAGQRLDLLLQSFRRAAAPHQGRHRQALLLCRALESHGAAAHALLGVGERQLERRAQAWLAVTPKLFQRLGRLHRALSAAVAAGGADAQLALQAGYYDQSHWARELRALAGAPLRPLLEQAHAAAPWWALETARRSGGFAH